MTTHISDHPGECGCFACSAPPGYRPSPGLYAKYHAYRVDGRDNPGGDKAAARYFVLDYVHDPFAREALAAYANACESDLPQLARDLRVALTVTERRAEA